METLKQGCISITEKRIAKTAVVSVIRGAMDIVKKVAAQNKLQYTFIGIDQNGNTIIRFQYQRDQQSIIDSICDYINFFESFVNGLKSLAESALKIVNDELLIAYLKLKAEKEQEDLRNNNNNNNSLIIINQITDGNQGGK